jgi:hypothetical protein
MAAAITHSKGRTKKMLNLKRTLKDYSDRKELTADEKKVVLEAYEESKELKLKNFIDEVIIEKIQEKNYSIPDELVIAYTEELDEMEENRKK